jgi:DNA repair protein RecN (Recombination protein N)
VAESIGRAMADVARHRQVICVTHLAQIAAFGTTHFVVEKGVEGEATRSTITEVRSKVRVQELARMISGATVTEAARKAAIEMLRAAEGGEVASSRKAGRPPPQPQREPQGA